MKKIVIVLFLFILFLFLIAFNYSKAVFNDLSESFFRLHILANSDSPEDQNLKLKVRDKIIEYMNSNNFSSKENAYNYCIQNIPQLIKIAKEVILENGYNYDVNIEIGNFYFPTKYYGNISLPSGFYDGMKIEIGNAQGQNWWCSLFPPLCFVDISSGVVNDSNLEDLETSLNTEEFKLVTSSNSNIKFKFKIIEFINNL